MKMYPDEMRAAAGDLNRLGQDTGTVQERLHRSWGRLDQGWQSYERDHAEGRFREAMGELSRMEAMLRQMGEALNTAAELVETADREAAGLFEVRGAGGGGSGGGGPAPDGGIDVDSLPESARAYYLRWQYLRETASAQRAREEILNQLRAFTSMGPADSYRWQEYWKVESTLPTSDRIPYVESSPPVMNDFFMYWTLANLG